ncbi:hypothetical protein [Flavobacterium sp. SM2513]|uniref:hypothetical protein n=1 Tax=Flavobacterium sp. SM2513 TaxID=3424766 RepID=UPI003D7FE6C0
MTLLFKPVFPVLEYVVNYDYIVNELCENIAKPELHCNGKCHLAKELAKASTDDTSNSSEKKVVAQQYELVYFQEIKAIIFSMYDSNFSPQVYNSYTNNYYHLSVNSTFHPPNLK